MAMKTEKLSHTGAELDRAVSGWLNTLIPTYTLPEQVHFTAALDPTVPQVHLYWVWKNTENANGIMIRKKQGALPEHSADGVLVCNITGTETEEFDDTAFDAADPTQVGTMADPVTWYYRAFPYNTNAQNQTHYQASVNLGCISVGVYYLEAATTLASLIAKSTFEFGRYGGKPLIWKVAHIEEDRMRVIMAENTLGFTIQFDAPETNNPNTDRKSYGNNRWSLSNHRQWLNTDKAGGEWFEAQHDYDVCSSSVVNKDGFLHDFTEAEKGIIIPQTRICLLPNIDGGGTETIVDKVWVPCLEELGFASENKNYPEGTVFQIFDGDDNTNANRADGYGVNYWTSTATAGSASIVRYVTSAGGPHNNSANISYAVRAGLTLPLSTVITYDEETGRFVVTVA